MRKTGGASLVVTLWKQRFCRSAASVCKRIAADYGMDQNVAEMVETATIAIVLFGIVVCLMQTNHSRVRNSFAIFLAAVAINNFPSAFFRITETAQSIYAQPVDHILGLSSFLCLAPLFWIYVYTLTSTAERRPAHLHRHFVLSACTVLAGLVMLFSSHDVWGPLYSNEPVPFSGLTIPLAVALTSLELALYPQMAVYLFLIVRRMMLYREKLRDVYASTEEHELRWIYAIGALSIVFWSSRTLLVVLAFGSTQNGPSPIFIIIAALSGLVLVATMTFWGLRQAPPLVPVTEPEQRAKNTEGLPADQQSDKYEKSALTPEASIRITRKLQAAMEADHLHRDANLSLWVLARHIGAQPNYISQTLNDAIGMNFFDFVNSYRVAEAKGLLSTTDKTVLEIAYEVGFNARSSFYNAFKRLTGETPTGYRKTMSQREGLDDTSR